MKKEEKIALVIEGGGFKSVFSAGVLDTFLMDRPISVPYELKLFYNDKEMLKKSGISTGSKTQSDSFEFFIPSDISGILVAKFDNLAGNKLAHVEFPLLVDRIITTEQQYFIQIGFIRYL